MQKQKFSWLNILGYSEACSLLILLGICSPLKWFYGIPEPVRFMGMIHGCLFLFYCGSLLTTDDVKLTYKERFIGMFCSVLPFGPFWFHKHYLR
jgi:integral membrane protein